MPDGRHSTSYLAVIIRHPRPQGSGHRKSTLHTGDDVGLSGNVSLIEVQRAPRNGPMHVRACACGSSRGVYMRVGRTEIVLASYQALFDRISLLTRALHDRSPSRHARLRNTIEVLRWLGIGAFRVSTPRPHGIRVADSIRDESRAVRPATTRRVPLRK
jgi:hypothetical protein